MIDVSAINNGVMGLVGIRQPYDPDYAIFDANNLQSDSGLFVDDVAFVKGEFFIDVVAPFKTDDLQKNELFSRMMGTAATSVVSKVFNDVDFIDRQVFYSKANNLTKLQDDLKHGFLGYKIQVGEKKNIAFKINRLFLELEGSGNLEIMLFNTNNQNAIETKTVPIVTSQKSYEIELNWTCNNTGFYKGEWYIGYNYDVNIQPFDRDFENASYENNIIGLEYEKISVNGHINSYLFDLDSVDEVSESNGMNLDITVYEDFTNLVLTNKFMFARAIQLQFAALLFQEYISSTRSNSNERYASNHKATIMAALKGTRGDGIKESGLENSLNTELATLKKEVLKLRNGHKRGKQITVRTLS